MYFIPSKNFMKRIILSAILALVAINAADACPKGQHIHGGTGSHYKGGYCSYDA